MSSKAERYFLIKLLETSYGAKLNEARKVRFWELLMKSEAFDRFAGKKFPNVKRYGLEGGEATMVLMDVLVECSKASPFFPVPGPSHKLNSALDSQDA